ncbi:MAG: zinc ribbon domain-containing protein [Armatimonadetes bacterium]|nr:zinc ribbon domain-containing protein [Armatimonadota bacterium]
MPLYEYVCGECGQRFEQLVWSSKDADQVSCTSCGASKVRRLISVFATASASEKHSHAADAPPCGPNCCRLH